MADRNVKVVVRADVADFLTKMKLVAKGADDAASSSEKVGDKGTTGIQRFTSSLRENASEWQVVGGAMATYGAAVTGLMGVVLKTGIEYNTLRQTSTTALTSITGNAEAAAAQMDRLDAFATNSPFARDVFIRAQQQLMAFGMEADRVVPTLDAIQNAVAAAGGSNQDIADLAYIIGQVGAAGKITATDLMQLGQRGIDAASIIGEQMGKTGAQIREEITAGTLGADEAIRALTDGMSARFDGAASGMKNTFAGAIDRVKAAVRDLGSALAEPLVSADGGGFLVDAANNVADFLRVIEGLPGPVLSVVGALTGLSGVAALAGGGFLMMAPRVVETADAMVKLGIVAPETLTKLKGIAGTVAKGGGIVVGLMAAAAAADALATSMHAAAPGVEEMRGALLDLEASMSTASLDQKVADMGIGFSEVIAYSGLLGVAANQLAPEIDSMGAAFERVADPGLASRFESLAGTFLPVTTSADRAGEAISSLDQALAQLATTPEGAERAMALLGESLAGTNVSSEQALEHLPALRDALAAVENEAKEAELAANDFREALKPPEGMDWPTRVAEGFAAAKEAAAGSVAAWLDLKAGIDDASLSLDGWLDSLLEEAAARENWVANMRALAEAGVDEGFLAGLVEMGPEGAVRVQEAVDQIASGDTGVVDRMNQVGSQMGTAVVDGLAADLARASGELDPVEVQAEVDRSQLVHMATRIPGEISETMGPATLGVDADTTRAQEEAARWAAAMPDVIGMAQLHANDSVARSQVAAWNQWAGTQEGVPTLNANPERARRQIAAWKGLADGTIGTSQLNAQRTMADRAVAAWRGAANSTFGTASLRANTSEASGAVSSFRAWASSPISVTVTARVRQVVSQVRARLPFASGGIQRRASGDLVTGYAPHVAGPAYGVTDLYRVGLDGLTHYAESASGLTREAYLSDHPSYRDDNVRYLSEAASWFGKKVVDAYDGKAVSSRTVAGRDGDGVRIDYRALAQAMSTVTLAPAPLHVDGRDLTRATMRGAHDLGARATWAGQTRIGRGTTA